MSQTLILPPAPPPAPIGTVPDARHTSRPALIVCWTLSLLIVVACIAWLVTSRPAAAAIQPRWQHPAVCVQDHAAGYPVQQAVEAMQDLPDIRLEWAGTGLCAGQTISVHSRDMGANGLYGWTQPWLRSDGYYDFVTVDLNEHYREQATDRVWLGVVMHELLHALGLGHADHPDSLMNTELFFQPDRPTEYDRQQLDRLYPW